MWKVLANVENDGSIVDNVTAPAVPSPELVNGLPIIWRAHPGPQTRFLSSTVFEALYGGQAGGAKSSALLMGALRQIDKASYRALILRRTFPELRELMDRSQLYFAQIGGIWSAQDKRWKFPSGATVEFGYCETYNDVLQYQGQEFQYIAYDELGQVADERVWTYLMSRCRSSEPGLLLMMRASANPGGVGHHWIKRRFIDVCPPEGTAQRVETKAFDGTTTTQTRAFFRARLQDNLTLMANDPTYGERLKQLTETEYRWLALGDWDAGGGAFYPELTTQQDQDRLFISAAQLPPLLDWHEYWGAYDWGFIHPATFGSFVRVGNTVYCLDTLFMHRYQDEEQADRIKGASDRRCLRTVYAGHDAFAKRLAHSAAAETVADVFGRYSIALEKAAIDRAAGAKVVRRLIARPPVGPLPKGTIIFRFVDTPGNRRVVSELAALIPEETHPDVPAKRDANEHGLYGDDGADMLRYGVTTPSFEGKEPQRPGFAGNVETGVDDEFERLQRDAFTVTQNGVIDRRTYVRPDEDPRLAGVGMDSGFGENEF